MDRLRPRRPGFTLVELLMVILIIAALIAILVPTLASAFRKAKEAQVSAEMSNMATALASFKNTYGDFPPSRVVLCEAGYNAYLTALTTTQEGAPAGPLSASGNGTDLSVFDLVQRSRLYLRRFWPRVDFDGGTIPFNFNGDNDTTDVIVLSGSECLTFFLGGVPAPNATGTFALNGFSKLPKNPFANLATSPNRTAPNYEFNVGRLVDDDGDGVPSYLDPINTSPGGQRSYAYFLSYGLNSYDPNDVNGNGSQASPQFEVGENGSTAVERGFLVGFPVVNASGAQQPRAVSPAPNPYTSGPPAFGNVSWVSPSSYQIISAGQNGEWGLGGTYTPNSGGDGKLPILPTATDPGNINSDTSGVRQQRESDNVTSFSNGRLD